MHLETVKDFVIATAREAGEIAKKYFYSKDFTSKSKGGADFVTQADLDVDAFLRKKLQEKYPQSQFLTEETAPADFSNLKDAENLWVIDPIDGTSNFSRGDEHFAISISLVNKSVVQLGIVYLPVEDRLYVAQADKDGAYCNSERIHVSAVDDLMMAMVACDWSWDFEARRRTYHWLEKFLTVVRQPRSLGSAAADLAMVAEGRLEVYVDAGIKPWDIAAACLIVEKAGGKITAPDGTPYDIFQSDILATNTLLHGKFGSLISK